MRVDPDWWRTRVSAMLAEQRRRRPFDGGAAAAITIASAGSGPGSGGGGVTPGGGVSPGGVAGFAWAYKGRGGVGLPGGGAA